MSIYDFVINDYSNNEVDFKQFKGKVLLIVNTATKCLYTKQYDSLVALYNKYKDQGFEILDFPCNQFFHQAPGDITDIHNTCLLRFDIKFTQFQKIDVNGKNEHPLYKFLKSNVKNGSDKKIKWNFTKFLVSKGGEVLYRFEPKITPSEIEPYIVELLNVKG